MQLQYKSIESHRSNWLASSETIVRMDMGAGSATLEHDSKIPVSQIARHALSRPFQCRFMSRLVEFINAKQMVEFGTSLGISSAYLSAGSPGGRIDTVEADPEIAHRAMELFRSLEMQNIHLHLMTFEAFIQAPSSLSEKIDFLFIDGNHRSTATIASYTALKPFFHSNTVVVVDDIYWSKDMTAGWKQLIALPEITQSVDCFHFGLLFFNPDFKNKDNHTIHLPIKMMLKA